MLALRSPPLQPPTRPPHRTRHVVVHAVPATAAAPPPPWRCPVCDSPLNLTSAAASLTCASGHAYDVARQGYVNLTRQGRKKRAAGRGEVGDGAASYAARRRVFAAGVFDPVFEAAAAAVGHALPDSGVVLDAGCGDGSYAAAVAAAAPSSTVICIDVARAAVAAAATRLRTTSTTPYPRAAVASSFAVPLEGACVDVALVAFAPFAATELSRVLRPSGAAVVVRPGPRHLDGLKALIYGDDAAPRAPPPPPGAAVVSQELDLTPEIGGALLAMTPYAWRGARADAAAATIERDGLKTRIEVIVETVGAGDVEGWQGR